MATPYEQRTHYEAGTLELADLDPDPVRQLDRWVSAAIEAAVPEPLAMTVATVDAEGRPHSRVVLCRGVETDGLRFFTNYDSNKGRELAAHPVAALLFFWPTLERQVRIEGTVERLPRAEADAYFQSRPRESQIGAWASPQSRPIDDRSVLERAVEAITARYRDQPVPLPPNWGGFRVRPQRYEFWQGRIGRLHDRFVYVLSPETTWQIARLAP